MKVSKKLLYDFARFLFRSGEVSYQKNLDWEESRSVDEYIYSAWKEFLNNRLSGEERVKLNFNVKEEEL